MNFLSTILILLFVGQFDTKYIFKINEEFPDDENDGELGDDTGVPSVISEDVYELLGLVVLDSDTITRRSSDTPDIDSTTGLSETDEEELEPRAHHRRKKQVEEDLGNDDFDDEPVKSKKKTAEKKPLRNRESIRDVKIPPPKMLRAECLNESQKDIEKCNRACNRAHEDVCDRLDCSSRSKKALKKECTFNCNKIFDPKFCY